MVSGGQGGAPHDAPLDTPGGAPDGSPQGTPAPAQDPSATGASSRHVPVLLQRCVDLLAPALDVPGAVVVDATLGMGGHSEALLERCPQARLVALDRDPAAVELARHRLTPHAARVDVVHAVFDELPQALSDLGITRVHGVLFDLGVSSLQVDEVARGFSYSRDAPLDMRMDPSRGQSAADVLETYSAAGLTRVLRDYGEERFARRIAERVVARRERAPLTTTSQLADLVRDAVPAATRRTGGNPAKRTFQALRIEVNGELDALRAALPAAVDALAVGGRVVVMSFQSLEDRITKRVLAAGAASTAPHGLPVELPEHAPLLRLLTRGAETAAPEETTTNPRSASVRLRAAERVREGSLERRAA